MLMPKKVKNRKTQKGRTRGVATRGNDLAFACQLALQIIDSNKRIIGVT